MTDRYTRKDAERAYERLRFLLNKQETRWVRGATTPGFEAPHVNLGSWSLDYNPVYGGFVIDEICTIGGGVTQPFGSARHPAHEFCAMVNFAIAALSVAIPGLQEAETARKRRIEDQLFASKQ